MTGAVWFTADTHFGHKAMSAEGKGFRPFETLTEHDECLIDGWNRVVRPRDQVWHLGDVGIGRPSLILDTVSRLHGEKHLITGNHDEVWPGHRFAHKIQRAWLREFTSIQQYARRRVGGIEFLLSHFPYRGDHVALERYATYRLRDEGLPLVHGHVHAEWAELGRQVNVGVDVRNWRPIALDELLVILRRVS